MRVRIGTRGSDLALWQAHHVAAALEREADVEVELVVLATRGDVIEDIPLQKVEGKAFFTAEIESALLDKRVDIAVHSHKDLATQSPAGLCVIAVPPRASAEERLLMRPDAHDPTAAFLPLRCAARVGTSAPRRAAQLLALRPDLHIADLRGNVPTRVRKLREGQYDAIVLAAAGLERLELDLGGLAVAGLDGRLFTPAPAQGALAIQVREGDQDLAQLCRRQLNDAATAECVAAERSVLVELGGGCNLPLGVLVAPATIPTPHPPRGSIEAPAGDTSETKNFVAHGFFGADHPLPGLPARWARALGSDPADAAARLRERLLPGRATGCGPLSGLRVCLTGSGEPQGETSELAARLAVLGAEVRFETVIEFESLDARATLADRLADLRPGDVVALTSRQAARELTGLSVPQGVVFAVVGPASARALRAAGHEPTLVGRGGAADLARALELRPGARVLFPCAQQAREDLERELATRGVEVERLPLYRVRAVPDVELGQDCDARVYMSPSSVSAAASAERRSRLPAVRLALGASTAEALEQHELEQLALQDAPNQVEAVLWTLARIAGQDTPATSNAIEAQ